jgi:exodeoxyribonuclease V gamma subunit
MPGLYIYKSNRLERLSEALAEVTSAPLRSVLQPELIVVQSLGMRRWLSLTLAGLHGVAMNCVFPFPADFMRRVFKAAFPDLEEDRAFDRELLPWRILKHLPERLDGPGFEELARYLQGDVRPLKEFQLARKIAANFDSYLAYRPEWILEWQAGRGQEWQAQLWRALARGHERAPMPALAQRLIRDLSGGETDLSRLPERVSFFGISSLPPFLFKVIGEVSKHLDVHFFHLDPTDLYWGDIQSAREQDRAMRQRPQDHLSAEDLHFETGNPLLASMGKAGRDFTRLLLEVDAESETSLFQPDPAPRHLLAHLQADIFQLEDGAQPAEFSVAPEDPSIQVHCCHSPMRELEALHDQLLALFEADPTLTPRDILVTMPDVEGYAPFIEAVFGAPESPEVAIPFSIADRSARTESTIADVFLRLLDLTGGRFGVTAVFSLLETPAIQRRFELAENDLPVLRAWVRKTEIRWGIDSAHRAGLGQPAFDQNTWRSGLRRLLLGYALPGDERTLFEDILPVREVEGELAATLGHFVDFADSLFVHIRGLEDSRPLADWERALRALLDAFFSDDDEFTDELHRIRAVLEALGKAQIDADFTAPVEFAAIREHLLSALADTDSGVGFLAGSATFCALKPMRSIPFKVICMLGMNDTAFPRHDAPPAFDLAAAQPRAGDRNLRDDDRHLFLETLLSARDALYISYSGLSNRDNKESPPCAPVGELLDYLDTRFPPPEGGLRRETLVRKHRLQPFSSAYFQPGGPLFSYSRENWRACEQARIPRQAPPIFAAAPLSEPEPEWRDLDWENLAKFFGNPARYFARERLGLKLPSDTDPFDDCEPQTLPALGRFGFEDELAREALATGALPPNGLHVARATGSLPPGYPGDSEYKTLRQEAGNLAERIRTRIQGGPLPPISVDLKFGPWRLSGVLRDVYPAALLRHRSSKLKAKNLLSAWIAHLVLQCVAPESGPKETLLFARDAAFRFRPVEDPAETLRNLIDFYGDGLRLPLPFFPDSSYEFAKRTLGEREQPLAKNVEFARAKWMGANNDPGERDDPWIQLCFRGAVDPLDLRWQETALRIFEPLLAHREKIGP